MRPGAPICRWRTPEDIAVDVMPAEGSVLGFSNRWYGAIVERPVKVQLSPSLSISIPTAPLYVAAKWEAFLDRGADDPLISPDLQDVISVVAGRPEIVAEVQQSPAELRDWLADAFARFMEQDMADYTLQGVLGSARLIPGIIPAVRDRFERMAESDGKP